MTNEPHTTMFSASHTALTRRTLLKGTLAAGVSTLALPLFGNDFPVHETVAYAADEMLPSSRFTIKSTIAVNLTKHFATTPLHQGTFNGQPVWYVITDASDEGIASDLGLNFAPRLANIPAGSPAVQTITAANPVLGRDAVTFASVPNFSPMRIVTAGPKGFPPADFSPGAFAAGKYSDLVRVQGSDVVYNAPIIAVGTGPFDVTDHTNTHDRLLAIDTAKMTADLLMVRAFSHGKDILYHSFSSSDVIAAPIERGTHIAALAEVPFTNTRTTQAGARSSIFAFVNGRTGAMSPPAQGLNHVIIDGGNTKDASLRNTDVLEALHQGGDAHNVLDAFTTLRDPALARLYTPLWDLQLAKWSDEAVAQGLNTAQTDANQIRQLASRGLVLAPDGLPITTQNVIVNCPIIAFIHEAPEAPQAPDPGRASSPLRGAP